MVRLAEILLKLAQALKDAHWHDYGDYVELNSLIDEIKAFIEQRRGIDG